MIVVIDEPRGEGWGGVVAAPVFRRVGEQVLNYLGVAVDEPVKLAMAGLES
jgi:cell division protein FtsI (penicillin-binding protein 3)